MSQPSPVFMEVLGLLMTDAAFAAAFRNDPQSAVRERGYALTPAELEKLSAGTSSTDGAERIGQPLDDRVKKRSS